MKNYIFKTRLIFCITYFLFLQISLQSQTTWQNITETADFNSVCFGNGIFVAVGVGGKILTSTDGVIWLPKTSSSSQNLNRIKFLNSLFVAVGENGTLLTSNDASTWTTQNSMTTKTLSGIGFGASKFVVVGDGVIITSTTGSSWAPNAVAPPEYLLDVTFGNSQFVATSFTGVIKTSPDGTNWTPQTSGTTNFLFSIVFQNSLFVAVGNAGTIITSPDGVSWTARTSGTSSFIIDITFGNNLFVTCNGDGTLLTSPNGINWTVQTSPATQFIYGIAFGNSIFTAVLHEGLSLTSNNATTWTIHQLGLPLPGYLIYDITYNGQYTCLTNNGMLTSADGINWTKQTNYNNAFVNGITYDNTNKIYGVASTGNVLISTLTNQWGTPQNISSQTLFDITYGGGRFVIGSDFGVVYSGIGSNTWASASSSPALPSFTKVAYLNGGFVCLGTYSVGPTLVYSSVDGTTLVSKANINSLLKGIAFGGGKYVAVGTGGVIYSSTDLITWTLRTSGTTQDLNSVCYSYGYFVAVGNAGTILISTDGITWSAQASNTTDNLGKVVSANGISAARLAAGPSYVAVGSNSILYSVADTPLPLNLISFSGKNTENGNELTWKTADETNFSHFEIERSNDAHKFEKIGIQTPNESGNYEFIDSKHQKSSIEHLNFYRIRIDDLDGTFKYSKIISLENKAENLLEIYPNPASNYFSISENNNPDNLQIIDLSGKIVKEYKFQSENKYQLNNINNGIYLVKIKVGNSLINSKLIIQN